MFGLFVEHGPFAVDENLNLVPRTHAWSLTHNVLYIDNPVGTGSGVITREVAQHLGDALYTSLPLGFSFTGLDECYARDESAVASDLYEALIQFFTLFPNLRKNDFFVTGESYAGKYVPAIAYKIHTANPKAKLKINLQVVLSLLYEIEPSFDAPVEIRELIFVMSI